MYTPSSNQHSADWCLPVLKDFVEGRLAPDAWFAWWDQHCDRLQASLPAACFLRLKPGGHSKFPSDKAVQAVKAVSYVLNVLQVPHSATDCYKIARDEEHAAYSRTCDRASVVSPDAVKAAVARIKLHFPKFAALLNRQASHVVELEAGASDSELQKLNAVLGIEVPRRLKLLLQCSQRIQLEGLCIGFLFFHEARTDPPGPSVGMLCIADYFLEADGDQVLFDPRDLPADDPPVYYYAHDVPEVRPLATSFSGWLESLGRSPLFRE